MSLLPQQLEGLDQLLASTVPADNPVKQIRAHFPGIAVSSCDASDMRGETPFRRSGAYDVFLVDTGSHCWNIIDDPQRASGIVIAPHN
ncbi:MAG: HCV capsid domain containing protein [Burkholderiaceae bacterium]